MRRPHVYQRSSPRPRSALPASKADVAREIVSALTDLLAKAEAAGLPMLAYLLTCALREAERETGQGTSDEVD